MVPASKSAKEQSRLLFLKTPFLFEKVFFTLCEPIVWLSELTKQRNYISLVTESLQSVVF